jgi:hypothetical protein
MGAVEVRRLLSARWRRSATLLSRFTLPTVVLIYHPKVTGLPRELRNIIYDLLFDDFFVQDVTLCTDIQIHEWEDSNWAAFMPSKEGYPFGCLLTHFTMPHYANLAYAVPFVHSEITHRVAELVARSTPFSFTVRNISRLCTTRLGCFGLPISTFIPDIEIDMSFCETLGTFDGVMAFDGDVFQKK